MSPFAFQKFGRKMLGIGAVALSLTMAACGAGGTSVSSTSNASLTACHVAPSDLSTGSGGKATATAVTPSLKGQSIKSDGSTALQPLLSQAATEFDTANGTSTAIGVGGSGTGLADVEAGKVQLGDSDIFYQDKTSTTGYTDLVDHRVAAVAFTLVTSQDLSSTVQNLTTDEIQKIYNGTYTNWAQIGGPNEPITVVNRPNGSGTRATFEKYVLNATNEIPGVLLTKDSTGAVASTITTTKGAIGYVATGFVLDPQYSSSLFPVCIDGYGATATNINSGNYKYWSYEHVYTKGQPTAYEAAFLAYVTSSNFQSMDVPSLGFLRVDQLSSAATATHPLPAGAQ